MASRRKKKSPAEESSQTTIADLPEAVLLHIISLLPITAAIKTSAVARTWCNLWRSLPRLKFDMYDFEGRNINIEKSYRENRLLFAEFVDQFLRHRHRRRLPIQKFELRFFYRNYDHIRAYVDSWIRRLVDLKVAELDLNFGYRGLRFGDENDDDEEDEDLMPYEFHFARIVSSSIEHLKLRNCSLIFPRKKLKLNSIRKVYLYDFWGPADEIQQLLASCLNLDTFVLEFKGCYRDLSIVSKSLKHLTVLGSIEAGSVEAYNVDKNSLEICTPKLESIMFDRCCWGMYILKDVSSLVEATIDFSTASLWEFACWTEVVSSLTGVERLTIDNAFMVSSFPKTYEDVRKKLEEESSMNPKSVAKLKFQEKIFSETLKFYNLKYLKLWTGYFEEDILGLDVMLKKCPLLETLVLACGTYGFYATEDEEVMETAEITMQIPRLREVKMEGYSGTKNELYVVDLLKKHGVVLDKIVAVPAKVEVGEKVILPPPFLL